MRSSELKAKAEWVRKETVRYAMETGGGHLASSLSCVDILTALYYEIMEENDVCIVSKGHGGYAQRTILLDRTFHRSSNRSVNQEAHRDDPGCLEADPKRGVQCSTGSLGHGLAIGLGVALGKYVQSCPGHVWVIVGDGELEEGSCSEAFGLWFELARKGEKIPLSVIIDNNGLRAMGKAPMCGQPFYISDVVYGHDLEALVRILSPRPSICLASTIKGKGIPFMENKAEWHYRLPSTPEELSWIEQYLSS